MKIKNEKLLRHNVTQHVNAVKCLLGLSTFQVSFIKHNYFIKIVLYNKNNSLGKPVMKLNVKYNISENTSTFIFFS